MNYDELDRCYEEAEKVEKAQLEKDIERGGWLAEKVIQNWLRGEIEDYLQYREMVSGLFGEDEIYPMELALDTILRDRIGAETDGEKRDKLMALLNEVTESALAEMEAAVEQSNLNKIAGDR